MNSHLSNAIAALALCLLLAGCGQDKDKTVIELPNRQVKEKPLSASRLHGNYRAGSASANEQYLDREITIEGIVSSVSKEKDGTWTLIYATDKSNGTEFFGVHVTLAADPNAKKGDRVVVRGTCKGWIPTTENVVIEKANIISD